MTKGTESKVPRVRFKEFVGAWEQKKLGAIYTERNERGNDSLQILSVSIHSGISKGELDSETLGKQVRRSEDKSLYKHVYAGDLVLNMMRAWQGAIGVATIEGMVSPAYITAVPNGAIYPPFMDCGLRRSQIIAKMNNLSYGVTDFRKRLYWDSFVRIEFYVSSVSEQKKITAYFSHLDDLITLHQRKHDKLVALKQAMLQKMFPQDGATTPEIRFKGFEGDWEEKTLGELGKVATNKRIFMHQTSPTGDVPFYKIGTFGREPQLFISQSLFETYKERFPFPTKGDLLFSVIGSIGRVVEYTGKDEYFQDSNIVWLQHNGAIVNSFLKQFYSIVKWSGLEGSTIIHLYNKNILETKIWLPDQTEQHKIGDYFCKFDELISKHAAQLEKLKNIKSACLQKMFV